MRLPIHLQRNIAQLHFHDPYQSNRQIAQATGIAPNTVRLLRKKLVAGATSWEALQAFDDDAWRSLLDTHDHSVAQRKATPDWQWVHDELQRPDATLEQLWREWRHQCPDGVAYSQFTHHYRQWAKKLDRPMRLIHQPGKKLFVDFAGRTLTLRSQDDQPDQKVYVFVAALGFSNYIYLEGVLSQSTADWVRCHVNCFAALGGAAEWVVPDRLKAAVLRRERFREVINPAYAACLRHYNSAALPARARRAQDKAKVEEAVQFAQRAALFSLRDRVFFNLDELNGELRRLAAILNRRPFKKMAGCREERFQHTERAKLKPLPATSYELCDWRYQVRVGADYHVEYQSSFYSVPYLLAGTQVDLRFTTEILEILHRNKRVALHSIASTPNSVITLPEHQPDNHRKYLEGEPEALLSWAVTVGPSTEKMIQHHLLDRHDRTNGLKAAQRMRDWARLYGESRFEEVCSYALSANITALRSIDSILKASADKRPANQPSNPASHNHHENVRGADYFGDLT